MSNATNGTRLAILQPIFQYGFAGMCAVLLAIMVWQMHLSEGRVDKLMEMQSQTNAVIDRNTEAIKDLSRIVHDKL